MIHFFRTILQIQLVATNFIANNDLMNGVELLTLIGRGAEACAYLQTHGQWEQAAALAKARALLRVGRRHGCPASGADMAAVLGISDNAVRGGDCPHFPAVGCAPAGPGAHRTAAVARRRIALPRR